MEIVIVSVLFIGYVALLLVLVDRFITYRKRIRSHRVTTQIIRFIPTYGGGGGAGGQNDDRSLSGCGGGAFLGCDREDLIFTQGGGGSGSSSKLKEEDKEDE